METLEEKGERERKKNEFDLEGDLTVGQDPLRYSVPSRFALQGLHVAHAVTATQGAITMPIVSTKTHPVVI